MKIGLKKKRRRNNGTCIREKNKQPKKKTRSWRLERRKRVYIRACMIVTFPTSQAERLPLKAVAYRNTAPQQQQRSPMIKMSLKKKRALFKNRIIELVLYKKGRREKEEAERIRPDLGEKNGERVHVLSLMVVTFSTCQVERSPLKA